MASPANKLQLWNPVGRMVVFLLAATSIACLLLDFYKVCPMRTFTALIFMPALLVLAGIAVFDWVRGDQQLGRAVLLGTLAGLIAAVAYDIFRLPFVFANDLGIQSVIPPLNLFKVFPRFGAMILNQPLEQESFSLSAHLTGWIYHFSNGATFGVMYLALIGNPSKKHWAWGILMAVGLELGMLFTPYPGFFHIPLTATFIIVTLVAHTIFGITLGQMSRRYGSAVYA